MALAGIRYHYVQFSKENHENARGVWPALLICQGSYVVVAIHFSTCQASDLTILPISVGTVPASACLGQILTVTVCTVAESALWR